jgi:hypothetical protein
MNRWTKILMIGTVIAGATVSTIGFAGYRDSKPVVVNYNSGFAYGSIGDARSGAGWQYIGCHVQNNGNGYWTDCQANDANGNYLYCWSQDPVIAAIATGLSSDSYIYFDVTSVGYTQCAHLKVGHNSYYSPKQP